MKKWENFTDEELFNIVKENFSYRSVGLKLGYASDEGAIKAAKDMINQKGFDISHFIGQAWNKNNFDYSRFQYGKTIKIANALSALTALRGRKCEQCGLAEWNNNPIPLEIHHLDGNHLNNNLDNLQILCCNCHALTKNYKGKNISRKSSDYISDENFIRALKQTPNVRQALLKLGLSASGGNYARAYDLINKYQIKQGNI